MSKRYYDAQSRKKYNLFTHTSKVSRTCLMFLFSGIFRTYGNYYDLKGLNKYFSCSKLVF